LWLSLAGLCYLALTRNLTSRGRVIGALLRLAVSCIRSLRASALLREPSAAARTQSTKAGEAYTAALLASCVREPSGLRLVPPVRRGMPPGALPVWQLKRRCCRRQPQDLLRAKIGVPGRRLDQQNPKSPLCVNRRPLRGGGGVGGGGGGVGGLFGGGWGGGGGVGGGGGGLLEGVVGWVGGDGRGCLGGVGVVCRWGVLMLGGGGGGGGLFFWLWCYRLWVPRLPRPPPGPPPLHPAPPPPPTPPPPPRPPHPRPPAPPRWVGVVCVLGMFWGGGGVGGVPSISTTRRSRKPPIDPAADPPRKASCWRDRRLGT